MRTLIIADDLTGALDVAGPFAQRGVETQVLVDATAECPAEVSGAQVLSVNADTRHLTAQAAAQRLRDVLARVPWQGRLLIKKIDSTLRGQVVPETFAMMKATGRTLAIVAPAFPAQGRSMRAGVVHVKGIPLARTTFAHDALSPPPLEPLHEVFTRAGMPARALEPARLADVRADEAGVLVVDAQEDADLAASVAHLGAQRQDLLWVGSAGIAQALAAASYFQSGQPPQAPVRVARVLVVVGSRAEQSALQVRHLAARPDVILCDAPNGAVDEALLESCTAHTIVLRAVTGATGEGDAEQVAHSLAAAAVRVMARHRLNAVVATGGDTARALLAASGCASLQVMGDLLPGIPYSRVADSWWLVSKAGGFGGPETLAQIIDLLRA